MPPVTSKTLIIKDNGAPKGAHSGCPSVIMDTLGSHTPSPVLRSLAIALGSSAGLLALVALVAAGVLWTGAGKSPSERVGTSPAPTVDPTPGTPSAASAPRSGAAESHRALPGAGRPRSVVVRSLGIDAPVVPIATEGTALDPPDDPQVLGWWSGGAHVGAARGSALVTGHTVNAGGGAMDDLERVRRGAEVRVLTTGGSVRYVVESVRVLDKDTLARRAQDLFSQEAAGRLVLVTCEDWDGTGYRSNVVVTAVPAR